MLTANEIRTELERAFGAGHGVTCDCCEPFPGGRSPLERELLSEARYALDRFGPGVGLVEDGPSERELEDLAELATVDALVAARGAIVDRAARALGRSASATIVVAPVIVPLDPASMRILCHAETFDGALRRQCTRPASFTRDGLPVCRQHVRLARIRPAGD